MSNINLFESAQGKKDPGQDGFRGGKALAIPLTILIGVFLILGAAKLYASYLSGQKSKIDQENTTEVNNFNGKNVDRVADFDARMRKSSKEAEDRINYDDYFKELENLMVSGAQVESFNYSQDKIDLKLTADSFQTVARQVMSFKNSTNFKNLKVSSTSRNSQGKILFELTK
jgi:hypothetical protein